eukprot:TRINITY_DN5116_c0_g1_i1.p1 TRINITY_DN5116_c0_g1~~TRINITY_DN5116_c0_g1_i1.p1  ORF type:complete len:460 (+),score=137.76 TRINITY_DN5116_c0_g1_i1:117-1496(+)
MSQPPGAIRALRGTEALYAFIHLTDLRCVDMQFIFRLSGELDPQVLRQAVLRIQQKQPLLRCGLQRHGVDIYLVPVANAESLVKVTSLERQHDKHWEEVIEDKVNNNQPLKENSLLWEVTCLHDHHTKRHDVILSVSHSIFDGISSLEFSRDLLLEVAAAKKGNPAPVEPLNMINKSVFERIHEENHAQLTLWQRFAPRLMTGVYNEVLKKKHKLPYNQPCPFAQRRQKAVFVTVPANVVKSFYTACKSHNVSFTAGMFGVISNALQIVLNLPNNFNIVYLMPASIRKMVHEPDHQGLYHCATCPLEISNVVKHTDGPAIDETELWRIATDTKHAIHTDLKGHVVRAVDDWMSTVHILKQVAAYIVPRMLKDATGRGEASISNFGNFDGDSYPKQVGDLTIEGLFVASAGGVTGSFPSAMMLTHHDQLHLSFCYPEPLFSSEHAQNIVELIIATMKRFC